MTPEQGRACEFTITFGKYKGKTLEQIATTDPDGPRYLDWLVGQDIDPEVKEVFKTFLGTPWVSELVDRAVASRQSSASSEPVENKAKPKSWWEK
jgi:hypothetical protein